MLTDQDFHIVSDKLNTVSKSLQDSFRHQIITILLFVSYLLGSSEFVDDVKISGITLDLDVLLLIFPAALLFFLSRMALLTMIFIELSELFFSNLNTPERKNNQKFYRAFRPQTIFLSIVLSRNNLNDNEVRKWFHYGLSTLIYVFPGLNMAILLHSIVEYQQPWLATTLVSVALIVFAGLFYEYYNGTYTRKYRYLLFATFISMAIFFPLLRFFL